MDQNSNYESRVRNGKIRRSGKTDPKKIRLNLDEFVNTLTFLDKLKLKSKFPKVILKRSRRRVGWNQFIGKGSEMYQ